jgi:hypothetical protein
VLADLVSERAPAIDAAALGLDRYRRTPRRPLAPTEEVRA